MSHCAKRLSGSRNSVKMRCFGLTTRDLLFAVIDSRHFGRDMAYWNDMFNDITFAGQFYQLLICCYSFCFACYYISRILTVTHILPLYFFSLLPFLYHISFSVFLYFHYPFHKFFLCFFRMASFQFKHGGQMVRMQMLATDPIIVATTDLFCP